jgi:hypothetical protein
MLLRVCVLTGGRCSAQQQCSHLGVIALVFVQALFESGNVAGRELGKCFLLHAHELSDQTRF